MITRCSASNWKDQQIREVEEGVEEREDELQDGRLEDRLLQGGRPKLKPLLTYLADRQAGDFTFFSFQFVHSELVSIPCSLQVL